MIPQVATLAAVSSAVAEVDHPAHPIDLRPEVVGWFIAQRDQIERAGVEEEQGDRDGGIDRKHREGAPGGGAEAAQQPEERVADAGRIGEHHDGAHQRAGERAYDDAGEQQHVGIEPPARNQAEPVYQRHGAQGADEGGQRHGPGASGPGGDRDHRAEPGPAGEAQQVWLGQRVSDHGLKRRATDAEAAAHQKRQHHPRGAQIPHDGGGFRVGVPEPGPDLAERERNRSRTQADQQAGHDDQSPGPRCVQRSRPGLFQLRAELADRLLVPEGSAG